MVVGVGCGRISMEAFAGKGYSVAGEGAFIHDDDGRRDGVDGAQYVGGIDPGDEPFGCFFFRRYVVGTIGIGQCGELEQFLVGGGEFGGEHGVDQKRAIWVDPGWAASFRLFFMVAMGTACSGGAAFSWAAAFSGAATCLRMPCGVQEVPGVPL